MDIQERLTAFAMLGAEWVMWLLVLLSIVVLAIVLERAYYLLTTRDDLASLKASLLKLLRADDIEGAKKRLKASKSFEARIALAGLDAAEEGSASAEERMQGESALAKLAMERNLAFVGTVIGIIWAFHELDASQGQVSAGLMSEIGEALVATAIGLLVAIPAVAFFNLFLRMIKARLARGNALGNDVLAHLKAERVPAAGPYRKAGKGKGKKAAAADEESDAADED